MNTLGYNFSIDEVVWITDDTSARECAVTQVTIEIDPVNGESPDVATTYHLRPLSSNSDILLRPADVVFGTLEDVVTYISDHTATAPQLGTHTLNYDYTIGDTVWVLDQYAILESTVIQITFDIDPGDMATSVERVLYHVLPDSGNYSTLIREEPEVYPTKEDAVNYIKSTF